MEQVTLESIIDGLKVKIQEGGMPDPKRWLDEAFKMTVLTAEANAELAKLEQEVAQMKLDAMSEQENINVSAVRIQIDATDAYRELKKKRAMIKSAEELIRVAKKMSDRESGF